MKKSLSFHAVLALCELNEVPVYVGGVDTSAAHVTKNNPAVLLSFEDFWQDEQEDYTAVVLLHELAHVVWNRENEFVGVPLCNKTVIEIYNLECATWLRAQKLATDHGISLLSFHDVKKSSLLSYATGVFAFVQKSALANIIKKLDHEELVELSQELERIFHEYDV